MEYTKEEALKKIVKIAKEIINDKAINDLELAQKCVEIYEWLPNLNISMDERIDRFGTFVLIEDDLDDYGFRGRKGIANKLLYKDGLTKMHPKIKEIIKFYRKNIIDDCKKIVEDFEEKK